MTKSDDRLEELKRLIDELGHNAMETKCPKCNEAASLGCDQSGFKCKNCGHIEKGYDLWGYRPDPEKISELKKTKTPKDWKWDTKG